jgi:hypothetical protein
MLDCINFSSAFFHSSKEAYKHGYGMPKFPTQGLSASKNVSKIPDGTLISLRINGNKGHRLFNSLSVVMRNCVLVVLNLFFSSELGVTKANDSFTGNPEVLMRVGNVVAVSAR